MFKTLVLFTMFMLGANSSFAKSFHCDVINTEDPWSSSARYAWGPEIQWSATIDIQKGKAELSADVEIEGEDNPFAILIYRAQIANQYFFQGVSKYHAKYTYKLSFDGSTVGYLESQEGPRQPKERKELKCRPLK